MEFDPANNIIPFPNNLVLDPTTGKVNLPEQCNEGPAQTALRTGVLNKLDGFGTFKVANTATLTAAPDATTFTSDNVVLYKIADSGTPVTTPTPIPTVIALTQTPQSSADCSDTKLVDTVAIVPTIPLDQHSTYAAAILAGAKDADGNDFLPSSTWALVRQDDDPVTLDDQGNVIAESTPLDPAGDANGNGVPDVVELQGLDLLWNAHHPVMQFLEATGVKSEDVLLAWSFNTQTTTDPLDPDNPDSLTNALPTTKPQLVASALPTLCGQLGLNGGQCTAENVLDLLIAGACTKSGGYLACDAVGDILIGAFTTNNYQQPTTNPLAGQPAIPGQWDDPVHPTVVDAASPLQFIAFTPKAGCPDTGCPVTIFGHGLGSSKESLAAIAPSFASQGVISVAIDFVDSGSRAPQITNSAAIACDGTVDATANHQCFAQILSADLGTTRDNIRQTILDMQRLVLTVKACGTNNCGSTFKIDTAHVFYAGISLGGIIGTMVTSTEDFTAALLNVPGVGLVDILENTATPDISCPLVDGLIDAGVVQGTKSNTTFAPDGTSTTTAGTCLTPAEWQSQPGYQQFAGIARWTLDPSDGANYEKFLVTKRFLIEEVVNDQVVPNVATDQEGALAGLTPAIADPSIGNGAPSAAITTDPHANKWVRYPDLAPDPAQSFPGNAFEHASLLRPSTKLGSVVPGVLGTVRLQSDGITYLLEQLLP